MSEVWRGNISSPITNGFFTIRECSIGPFETSSPFWNLLRSLCRYYFRIPNIDQAETITCVAHSQQHHAEKSFVVVPQGTRIQRFSDINVLLIQWRHIPIRQVIISNNPAALLCLVFSTDTESSPTKELFDPWGLFCNSPPSHVTTSCDSPI